MPARARCDCTAPGVRPSRAASSSSGTVNAGYTFCPRCGGIVIPDADTTKRARVARGESIVVQRPPPRQVFLPQTPPTLPPPPLRGES
jgi:hypothetical protein